MPMKRDITKILSIYFFLFHELGTHWQAHVMRHLTHSRQIMRYVLVNRDGSRSVCIKGNLK